MTEPDTAACCEVHTLGKCDAVFTCCDKCPTFFGRPATAASAATLYRWQDDATLRDCIEARNVQPVGAFSRELLTQADGERLIYDGQTITLDVDNGRWVWQVTGQNADGSVIYGRWPD